MAATVIRNFIAKALFKKKGAIANNKSVDFSANALEQRLKNLGIDPNAIRSEQELNQILSYVKQAEDQAFQQRFGDMLGGSKFDRKGEVFDLTGKKINPSKGIMGGKEINEQTLKEGLMKTDNPFSDLVKTTEKGPKTLAEREAEVLARLEKENKAAAQRIRDRKRLEDRSIEDFVDDAGGVNPDDPRGIDDFIPDPEEMAQGGRVGLMAGSVPKIFTLLKDPKKVKQAIDNIFPTGDVKYDATMAAESLVELNPKIFGNKLYDDLDSITRLDIYDAVISPMMSAQAKALRMKKATKPEKTLQSMKEGKGINMSDPEIAKEFEQFMKQTDPEGVKKLEQTFELDNFDPKGRKKNATGGRAGFKGGSYDRNSFEHKINELKSAYKRYKKGIGGRKGGIMTFEQFAPMFAAENFATGGRAGFKDGLTPSFEDYLKERGMIEKRENLERLMREYQEDMRRKKVMEQKQMVAEGGRIGFKDGMTRRSFLKILGGLAAIPIVGKFLKPIKTAKGIKSVPIIKTDNVAGKPEWFDALVNKVIIEGDDVTKRFATADRQAVHQKTLDDGSVVRVTEDVDDGAVRVEYENEANVYGDEVLMEYKKPLPDEGAPNPSAEFTTAESGPVGRQTGPDDFDLDVDEVGGSSISDLDSDVSKLKEYATGKKPTMKEFVQNKKRRDKASAITNDIDGAASDAVIRRQGDYVPEYDDYAAGGIARMLGE
jgi:hypothetical protein